MFRYQSGKTEWLWNDVTGEIIESYGVAECIVGYAKSENEFEDWIKATLEVKA